MYARTFYVSTGGLSPFGTGSDWACGPNFDDLSIVSSLRTSRRCTCTVINKIYQVFFTISQTRR